MSQLMAGSPRRDHRVSLESIKVQGDGIFAGRGWANPQPVHFGRWADL